MFEEEGFEFNDENVTETEHIPQALRDFAQAKNTNPASLDFSIIEYHTLCKEGEQEWQLLDPSIIQDYKEIEEIARSPVGLKQEYKISIHTKVPMANFKPEISLFSDKYRAALQCTIRKSSDIRYFEGIHDRLRDELIKRQLLQGGLIGMFDYELDVKLQEYLEILRMQGRPAADFTLLLCSFPKPVPNEKDKIIFHHIQKEQSKEERNIKKPKNVYASCEKGECIVEYFKAKDGKNGRSFMGDLIKPPPIPEEHKPKFNTTDNIEIVEDETSIKYIAKINGYVMQDALTLDVTDTLSVQRATFKETGSIDGEEDTKVKIAEDNVLYDGVDSGVVVEGDQVELQGSIAGGAMIKAKNVIIHGFTHKDSKVYAQQAKIKLHRGFLKAQQVMVNRLEHGTIDGIMIKVNENMGGEIRGKKVYINNLTSNIKVTATTLIDIKQITGESNLLIIDPGTMEQMKNKKEEIPAEIQIQALRKEIEKLRKEAQLKSDQLKRKSAEVHQQVMQYKKTNTSLPDYLEKTLKRHKEEGQLLEALNQQISEKQSEIFKIQDRQKKIQESIVVAKVVCHSPWTQGNRIIFKTLHPPRTFEHVPKADDKTIKLIQQSDKEFYIQARPI